jgi:hypothetical protein
LTNFATIVAARLPQGDRLGTITQPVLIVNDLRTTADGQGSVDLRRDVGTEATSGT